MLVVDMGELFSQLMLKTSSIALVMEREKSRSENLDILWYWRKGTAEYAHQTSLGLKQQIMICAKKVH